MGEKERDRQLENQRERVREEVADPYGNRIKTLGKRNFSSGGTGGGLGSTHSARLEIRQRNPGTPYGVMAISPAAHHDVPYFSIH